MYLGAKELIEEKSEISFARVIGIGRRRSGRVVGIIVRILRWPRGMASIRIGVARLVPRFIQVRELGHSYKVAPTYGNHVAERLGIKIDEIMRKAA